MARLMCVLALALTVFAVPARADSAAAQEAVKLARLVMPETQYEAMIANISKVSTRAISSRASASGQALPAHFASRFAAEMHRMLPYQELIDLQAGLLVKYYTAAEIQDLTAFYKTPVGQKAIRIMPQLMADVTGEMQLKMQREMPAALHRIFESGGADKGAGGADHGSGQSSAGK